ncbi:MAG: Hsp70 family protein, partial [Candidatus Hodarchaeota archaeon]
MKREKVDYGIDLGTTNSAIAVVNNGELKVFRHEPRKYEILPSCVYFKSGQIIVGDQAYNARFKSKKVRQNVFAEFKRAMGSDDK